VAVTVWEFFGTFATKADKRQQGVAIVRMLSCLSSRDSLRRPVQPKAVRLIGRKSREPGAARQGSQQAAQPNQGQAKRVVDSGSLCNLNDSPAKDLFAFSFTTEQPIKIGQIVSVTEPHLSFGNCVGNAARSHCLQQWTQLES